MVKKQQMRWSPRGAHLLFQIPAPGVLNDTLAVDDYRRWYTPDFTHTPHRQEQAA